MSFVHLHVHTEFSLLDGSNKIKEYVKRLKELGMTAGVDGDVRVDDAQVGFVAAHHERLVIRGVAHIRVAGDLEIARGGGNGGAFGIIVTHGLSLRLFESLLKSLLQKLFFVFPL